MQGTTSNEQVDVTCSPGVGVMAPRTESPGAFTKLFSRKRRAPRLAESAEVDTRARPFRASVVEPFVDLSNCTFGVMESGTQVARSIQQFGREIFTDNAFQVMDSLDAPDSEDEDEMADKKTEEKKFSTTLVLSTGIHEGTFKGRRVVLLVQDEGGSKGTYRTVDVRKSLVVFVDGRGQDDFLQEFCEYFLKKLRQPPKKQHFQIYRWSHCQGYWKRSSYEKARLMKSVILPEGLSESIEADMERFLSKRTKNWYSKRGIPYKRCYMFYGVPGTGKTSIITALAGRFQRKVCFLSPHHPKFTDEALKNCLSRVPKKSIVVLEDIDSLFQKNRDTRNNNNPLTFTGLLNGLDGIGEHSGSIFIMTTNFIDRLDSALVRAGRVDMKVEFKRADDYQLTQMFKWFYDETPEIAEELAPEFVKEVRKKFPNGVTMAELQQHFIDNMFFDAHTAVKTVKNYDLPLMKKLILANPAKKDESSEKKKKEAGAKSTDALAKPAMSRSNSM